MERMSLPTMPARTASVLTFFYAMGYPIGALAVSAMSPMAVLVFRFGLAGVHVQFVCKLDRRPYRPCTSPTTYRKLAFGDHAFKVKVLSPPPGVSPAPVMARFQVIPGRVG